MERALPPLCGFRRGEVSQGRNHLVVEAKAGLGNRGKAGSGASASDIGRDGPKCARFGKGPFSEEIVKRIGL